MVKKVTKNYHVVTKHNLTQEELLLEKFASFLITLSLLFFSSFGHSATLGDVYELALTNDPQLKIDEATFNANKEIKNKAMAGLLPKFSLRAGTTWNENKNTQNTSLFTDTQGSNSNYYSANLIQPIFRVDTWFQFSQGRALGEAAEAKFALSQQETIIRISNVYFNLLKAKKNLEVAKLEEQSIKKQRDRTKRLYEEGVSSKSEYQEAQAFYDLAKVSKIASEGQLEFAREVMISIIGDVPEIKDLNDDFPISKPDPIEQDQWAELAMANSFTLKASTLNAMAAKKNSQAKLASHFPDIDLVASITQNNSRGIVGFNPATDPPVTYGPNGIEQTRYSLEFNWPIVTGGLLHAERREAKALAEQADQQELLTERFVIRDVKTKFTSVLTNLANVNARKASLKSSNFALKATMVGYEENTRNIVDLLNAEKNYFSAQRDLIAAKYDYIISTLELKLASGILSPADIYEISGYLDT
jgi:outer membrane protein